MKHTLMPLAEFTQRRAKFFAQMPDNSIAVVFAAQQVTRSNDTEYLFCQDKSFYYLTGFNEPDAILVLFKQGDEQCTQLFCLDKDPLEEVWHGRRIGAEKAVSDYGIDQAFTLEYFEEQLGQMMENTQALLYRQGHNDFHDQQLFDVLSQVKARSRQGVKAPNQFIDCQPMIDEMRLIKSEYELNIMRRANEISGRAHQRAMEKTADGVFEYQIEAELVHEFARHGARHAAYNSIVAGGDNANILHYTDNCDALHQGDLLLIDAGAELAGYAADITRTFPVSGKFTDAQKRIYQLVLDAQIACIEAVKPGENLANLNTLCIEILTKGLIDLGILSGDLEKLVEEKACKKYFIHGLGHWLGLDVHDVGDYQVENKRQLRAFEPGMVMTIEPGLYFPQDDESVDAKWRGIGVRIEDNVLVTDQGHENLTQHAVKSINDIERLMQRSHQSR